MEGNQGHTQLFLLRLWLEELPRAAGEKGDPNGEEVLRWNGKVQHVVRGEAYAFTGWDMLISCLEAMLLRDLPEATQAKAKLTPGQQGPQADKNNIGGRK